MQKNFKKHIYNVNRNTLHLQTQLQPAVSDETNGHHAKKFNKSENIDWQIEY